MDMYMSQNAIIITKVANGWAVQLPMTQKAHREPTIIEQYKPLIREALRMRGGDPVLEEIEEQNKQPEFIMPDPSIVADEGLYIFHEFKEVLEFLLQRFGE